MWWPYDGGLSTDLNQRIMNVKPMIPVARARWQFGEPTDLSGAIQLGTFNYKYNPEAKNLGEYLYRSGTYPGFIWSNDGWLLMNRAGSYSHGMLGTIVHLDGHLKHNVSLFMETLYSPIGDFSPGYDFTFNSKWIDLGGGAVLNHYIPIRPSALVRKNDENTYVQIKDVVPNALGGNDTLTYYAPKSEIPNLQLTNALPSTFEHRWTSKGVKLMGRATLNLGQLLPEEIKNPDDLKLFAEIALLGVADQPLFYEKKSERMPIMLGINLPTFKALDILSIQMEYYKSGFNDIDYFNGQSLPIWKTKFAQDSTTERYFADSQGKLIPIQNHKDDIKWSVHARKSVNKYVTVYAQAASDHFRLTDVSYKHSPVPLTTTPTEWYYLFRLEFSLR
jgi:hypothetical protein